MDDKYFVVDHSGKVEKELVRLRAHAIQAEHGAGVFEAPRIVDEWLRADVESLGEPTRDFPELRMTEYLGSYGPIGVTYTIHWERKFVFIVRPFQILRWAGF